MPDFGAHGEAGVVRHHSLSSQPLPPQTSPAHSSAFRSHAPPALTTAQKLPRTKPFGPSLEVPPWTDLAAQMKALRQALEAEHSTEQPRPGRFRGALDSLYY